MTIKVANACFHMLPVCASFVSQDENVIQKSRCVLAMWPNNAWQSSFECRGRIGEAERHDKPLIVAILSGKSGAFDALRSHVNSLEAIGQIKCSEVLVASGLVDLRVGVGEGKSIRTGNLVRNPIVDTGARSAVLFLNDERGARPCFLL